MIEPLESRIAPAAVLHYTEADGDKITVKTSKGTNAQLAAAAIPQPGGVDFDFTTSADFAGTNIKITAEKHGTGDGRANRIAIHAFEDGGLHNMSLGKVKIEGELLFINAGTAPATLAVKSITVNHWGPTDDGIAAFHSRIEGNIGKIVVKGDFNGWILSEETYTSAADGTRIDSLTIKGNIADTLGDQNGYIQVHAIARLVVKNSFFGPGVPGHPQNGLIEAVAITQLQIPRMTEGARIDLAIAT